MRLNIAEIICLFLIWIAFLGLSRADGENGSDLMSVRELWKEVVVSESRSYEKLLSSAQRISKEKAGSPDALTAEILIGKIEMNRALNEAESSLDKARAVFLNLVKKHEKSWQGQAAKLSLINLLHVEGKHSDVITEATKGLKEIDWSILGDRAPPDLADYKKITVADAEFAPDVLRMLLARSYSDLGKKAEAKQWAIKIENVDMRKETQESIQRNQ
jgi:hypothetical protein